MSVDADVLLALLMGAGAGHDLHDVDKLACAPWAPTPWATVRRMLELAEVQPGESVHDLGSGDGRVLIVAARRFGAHAVGVEIDPPRYVWTQILVLALGLRRRVRVIRGDMYAHDLRGGDVFDLLSEGGDAWGSLGASLRGGWILGNNSTLGGFGWHGWLLMVWALGAQGGQGGADGATGGGVYDIDGLDVADGGGGGHAGGRIVEPILEEDGGESDGRDLEAGLQTTSDPHRIAWSERGVVSGMPSAAHP